MSDEEPSGLFSRCPNCGHTYEYSRLVARLERECDDLVIYAEGLTAERDAALARAETMSAAVTYSYEVKKIAVAQARADALEEAALMAENGYASYMVANDIRALIPPGAADPPHPAAPADPERGKP